MKGTPLAICALLGATHAIVDVKEYVYDDATQYEDGNIKDFIEQTDNKQVQQAQVQQKPTAKPSAPVAKPVPAPKPEDAKKKEE